jgi:hypothetical protein
MSVADRKPHKRHPPPRDPRDPRPARHDRREVERFLRVQPIAEIPRRSAPTGTPGLIAAQLLGYRVIRRLDC